MDASRSHPRSRSIRRLIAGVATAAVTAALATVSGVPAAQAAGRPTGVDVADEDPQSESGFTTG